LDEADVDIGRNNRISNGYVGIQLEGSGTSGRVAGNTIDALSEIGISVIGGAEAGVTENTLTDAGSNGITVEHGQATVADIHHNRIIQYSGLAIKIVEGNVAVRANEIDGTAQIGIAARDGARAVIAGNTVSGVSLIGILAGTGAAVQARANTVIGGDVGIGYTEPGTTGTAVGNMVMRSADVGIMIEEGAAAEVSENQITEAAMLGVYVRNTGTRATVSDNAISGPGRDGIGFENGAQGTAAGNMLKDLNRTGLWAH
jgi:trimeric autotransporter adhesin